MAVQWSFGAYTFPIADQLIKVMAPTVVVIDRLQYSGGISESQMKLAIVEYLNNLTDASFDKSDLVNLLYDNGANYVDLNMTIQIREYDTEATRTTVKMDSQIYNLRADVVSSFYTHIDELDGVTQI